MSSQQYLEHVLATQSLTRKQVEFLHGVRDKVEQALSLLDGAPKFFYGGSYGRKTMIRKRYDLDIIAYWPPDAEYSVRGIYESVGEQLKKVFEFVYSKTVGWEIPFERGIHVDVIPGRALDANCERVELYRPETSRAVETSLKTHIETIRASGRSDAIRLLKLWREKYQVPFRKSLLLELMVVEGCRDCSTTDLPIQILAALIYIRNSIESVEITDPANSSNLLSDDIPIEDKRIIKHQAQLALNAGGWVEVYG